MTPLQKLTETVQFVLMEGGLPLGTIHTWSDGQKWVKTKNGWMPQKGSATPAKKEEPAADRKAAAKAEPAAKPKQGDIEKDAQKTQSGIEKDAAKAAKAKGADDAESQVKQGVEIGDLAAERRVSKSIAAEERTVPPDGAKVLVPDVKVDADGDGITDCARIGVGARDVPPPPKIPRLPNLTPEERAIETRLCMEFEADPDKLTRTYEQFLSGQKKPMKKITFGTDDVKETFADWNSPYEKNEKGEPKNGKDDPAYKENLMRKGVYNLVCHQVANAVAKRAFLTALDKLGRLPEDDPKRHVLVTSGGCAAGKGYALDNVAEVDAVQKACGAVWDAAGEQNATENPWVLDECRKRGLKPIFAFVDADPKVTWGDKSRGMIERAGKQGRVVDAQCFAESYGIGAKNMQKFHEAHKDDDDVGFVFLSSRGSAPEAVEEFPEEALKLKTDEVLKDAVDFTEHNAGRLSLAVKRGALLFNRIWGAAHGE